MGLWREAAPADGAITHCGAGARCAARAADTLGRAADTCRKLSAGGARAAAACVRAACRVLARAKRSRAPRADACVPRRRAWVCPKDEGGPAESLEFGCSRHYMRGGRTTNRGGNLGSIDSIRLVRAEPLGRISSCVFTSAATHRENAGLPPDLGLGFAHHSFVQAISSVDRATFRRACVARCLHAETTDVKSAEWMFAAIHTRTFVRLQNRRRDLSAANG